MDQFDQAMRYHQEALEVEKKRLGSLHPSIASELRGIGILLRDQRRYHESQDYMQKALSLVQKSLGPDHIRTSDFYLLVGINLMYMNRPADAYREFQRCYDIRKQVSEKAAEHEYERRAEAAYFLGLALTRLGRYSEALAVNQEGLKLAEKDLDFKPAREAYNLHAIGVILFALGHSSEAAPYLERALSIRQNQRDEERRENLNHLAETQFGLAQVLWSLGGMAERQRAVELARAAQTNYTEWGNKPENELGAVTAWLAAGLNKPTEVAALGLYEGAVPAAKDGSGGTPLSP